MKKITFFLCALLISAMSFAQVVTFSPANETAVESKKFTLTSGDVTLVCSSGTITADQFRFFKSQTVTISSTGGNIVSVEFTCTASDGAKYGPGCFTTTSGDYTYSGKVGTWTGEANEVTFTASSNQVRATQVVVTLLAAGGVPQPSIQGATDFIESTEVSIVASEGLKVYYTLDGTDPTTESTEYTAPFTVEETTTVKAIAHDGTNASDVTETTFTKATKVTCAEAAEIASQLSGNNVLSDLYYVVVGYVTELDGTISNGQQKFWVSDTKGGANTLYSYWCNVPQELVVGDYIQMFGKLTKYYEKNQMKNGDVTILEEPTPEPVKYTVTATAENGTVEGAGKYEEGTEVTLTATAAEGYEFVNWTKGEEVVSTENPYTFVVTADVALVANFAVVEPEVIEYVLNGGVLPLVGPTNAELWGTDTADVNGLMHYFNHYHNLKRSAQDISADVSTNPVATFLTGMPDEAGVFVDEESKYKWLGDYIVKVTNDQIAEGKLSVLEAVDSNVKWRYGVQAFFMCLPATDNNYKGWADFTEAGKPENWVNVYPDAKEVELPTEPVEEDYVLPTPTKSGSTFKGWYNNAEGTGEAYTVIPAGWAGTLYAIWEQGTTTALENIAVEGKAVKAIVNGQLIIIKNGVQYNAQGQVVK